MALRQQYWVDRPVQLILVLRVSLYWLLGFVSVAIAAASYQYNKHPNWSYAEHSRQLFEAFWPWLPTVLLVLPLVMFDIIRLSNSFVGPIYRLRRHLDKLIENPTSPALSFRHGDYWQDIALPINLLQGEIIRLRQELAYFHELASAASADTQQVTDPDSDLPIQPPALEDGSALPMNDFENTGLDSSARSAPASELEEQIGDQTAPSSLPVPNTEAESIPSQPGEVSLEGADPTAASFLDQETTTSADSSTENSTSLQPDDLGEITNEPAVAQFESPPDDGNSEPEVKPLPADAQDDGLRGNLNPAPAADVLEEVAEQPESPNSASIDLPELDLLKEVDTNSDTRLNEAITADEIDRLLAGRK
ncbi:MAG: hypothetical protein KDB03_14915 [Planctomycetales bacterium]|nr:hypothetical protein [Planctomycetales bacterium]